MDHTINCGVIVVFVHLFSIVFGFSFNGGVFRNDSSCSTLFYYCVQFTLRNIASECDDDSSIS